MEHLVEAGGRIGILLVGKGAARGVMWFDGLSRPAVLELGRARAVDPGGDQVVVHGEWHECKRLVPPVFRVQEFVNEVAPVDAFDDDEARLLRLATEVWPTCADSAFVGHALASLWRAPPGEREECLLLCHALRIARLARDLAGGVGRVS